MSNQNPGDTPSQQPDQTQEQLAPVYTWDQIKDMRAEGIYPELIPGTVVTGFDNLGDLNQFNDIMNSAMRQDLPANRAGFVPSSRGYIRGIHQIQPAMEGLKREQRLHQPLENLRVVFLEPDKKHLADLSDQREANTPAISLAYIADCSSTGRGKLPGAVTVMRTYAIGPTGAAPNTDPASRLDVIIRTRKIPSDEWRTILERSKETGHLAVAAAVATAFSAGLPSLGKRR